MGVASPRGVLGRDSLSKGRTREIHTGAAASTSSTAEARVFLDNVIRGCPLLICGYRYVAMERCLQMDGAKALMATTVRSRPPPEDTTVGMVVEPSRCRCPCREGVWLRCALFTFIYSRAGLGASRGARSVSHPSPSHVVHAARGPCAVAPRGVPARAAGGARGGRVAPAP